MADLMEYMKIQWADIHHSRNQEWKFLAIIAGIFYALIKVEPKHDDLRMAITVLGMIACGMGAYMSFVHWQIFYSKMRLIWACEENLGINAYFFKPPFPVQGLILLIYFFAASIFSGWFVWLWWENIWISSIIFTICFLVGIIMCNRAKKRVHKTVEGQTPLTIRDTSGIGNE